MKPRVYDGLVQSAVELSCFGTGQSTVEEGREAYQEWLREHDQQTAERAWAEGFKAGSSELFNDPHNPYRKKELK